jgi:hypothetical protein
LKDIGNSKPQLPEALHRLERAIARLEAAASARQAHAVSADAAPELERLSREHAALKERAGSVAERLDGAIGRLQHLLRE